MYRAWSGQVFIEEKIIILGTCTENPGGPSANILQLQMN